MTLTNLPVAEHANAENRVLTVAETAELLGVSVFTLLRKRQRPNADGLPFVQLSPKRIGYRVSDIMAFLNARRVGSLPKEVQAA
jgi:hypothetical protein